MMKYCENHLSSASMVFFSHKVDICNNKDVIDGVPGAAPPAHHTTQMSPKLSEACRKLDTFNTIHSCGGSRSNFFQGKIEK